MNYQEIILFLKLWFIESGIKVIAILAAAWIVSAVSKVVISRIVRNYIEKGLKERTDTVIKIFSSTKSFAVWLIAFLMILPEFGINPFPLLAGAGLVGLAIGMGAKNLIQDYISGIFILLEDQYRVGERVEMSGSEGEVVNLSLRRTVIKDEKGDIHIVPNGQIVKVSNLSRK